MRLKVNQLLQTGEEKLHPEEREGEVHGLGFIKKTVLYRKCDVNICSHSGIARKQQAQRRSRESSRCLMNSSG